MSWFEKIVRESANANWYACRECLEEFSSSDDDMIHCPYCGERDSLISEDDEEKIKYPETPSEFFEAAKVKFGTTTNPGLGGWLLPDGEFLNFSFNGTGRDRDHREVRILFSWEKYGDIENFAALKMFMDMGAIRTGNGMIDLSRRPTRAQYDALMNYVNHNRGEVELSIYLPGTNPEKSEYENFDGSPWYQVEEAIAGYFANKTGTTKKMNLDKHAIALQAGHFEGLEKALYSIRGEFATAAQKLYDEWQQDDDGFDEEYGTGGLCDAISRAFAEVVNERLSPMMGFRDIETVDGGPEGDDHAYVIVINPQTEEAAAVDIPPHVYETGAGYSWKKTPGVTFSENDVVVHHADYEFAVEPPYQEAASSNEIVATAGEMIKTAAAYTASGIEIVEIIRERHYRSGYILRDEIWRTPGMANADGSEDTVMEKMAYTPSGDYIGTSKEAHYLCSVLGIKPELADKNHTVCSVGYSSKKKKWFGWSHRAISGFGVGDMIFEELFGDDNTSFRQHGDEKIKKIEEARKAACNFANYVS